MANKALILGEMTEFGALINWLIQTKSVSKITRAEVSVENLYTGLSDILGVMGKKDIMMIKMFREERNLSAM